MKKFNLLLITMILLTAVLSACGKKEPEVQQDNKEPATTAVSDTSEETQTTEDTGYAVTYNGDSVRDDLGESGEIGGSTIPDSETIDVDDPETENPEEKEDTKVSTATKDYIEIYNNEDGSKILELGIPVGVTAEHKTILDDDTVTFTWGEQSNTSGYAYFRYSLGSECIGAKLNSCVNDYIRDNNDTEYKPSEDVYDETKSAALKDEVFTIVKTYDSSDFGRIYVIRSEHTCDPEVMPECSNELRYYVVCYDTRNANGDFLTLCFEDGAGALCKNENLIITNTEAILRL